MKFASRAIVMSSQVFGEADRYVQFLTQQWGMITVLAKSARKSRRRYAGGLDLFCHDEIFLKGDPKDRPYLTELTVLNSFQGMRENLDRMIAAGKITHWTRKLADTTMPIPQIYSLLGQTLALIEKEADVERLELLSLVFRLKLLSALGLKPRVESCVRCESVLTSVQDLADTDARFLFELEAGGVICGACFESARGLPASLNGNPDGRSMLCEQERQFLDVADRLRLIAWSDISFPTPLSRQLLRLVTQFASFHTHVGLPL